MRGLKKYAQVEGVTLLPSEEICPSRRSNSPAAGTQNLTQFGEKEKELRSNYIRPYIGQYGDVPGWRVADTHDTLLHDLSELMAKRTMGSALHNF